MWKSVFCYTATIYFYPQANVDNFSVIHREIGEKNPYGFPQVFFPHSTTPVENFFTDRN